MCFCGSELVLRFLVWLQVEGSDSPLASGVAWKKLSGRSCRNGRELVGSQPFVGSFKSEMIIN